MDESIITHNRRARRSPVLLAATVEVAGTPEPVKLRNLSQDGALVEGERLPDVDTHTIFRRNELEIKSRVAWVEGRFAGIAFAYPLDRKQVLRNVPEPRQRMIPEFRRPGLACRPLTSHEKRMLERWMAMPADSPGD